jgi:subtilisin family serine protease
LTFAAAGNEGRRLWTLSEAQLSDASEKIGPYIVPAALPAVHHVVACTFDGDALANFSNFSDDYVAATIGRDVWAASHKKRDGYVRMNGTSMATPIAVGFAANLVLAGAKTPAEVMAQLSKSSREVPFRTEGIFPELRVMAA